LFINTTLDNILQEQYYLARHGKISLLESSLIPDFEREIFLAMLSKEMEEEAEMMKFEN